MKETYLVWTIKAGMTMVLIIADSKDEAIEKASKLIPDTEYSIGQVCEYFLPWMVQKQVAEGFDKFTNKLEG